MRRGTVPRHQAHGQGHLSPPQLVVTTGAVRAGALISQGPTLTGSPQEPGVGGGVRRNRFPLLPTNLRILSYFTHHRACY